MKYTLWLLTLLMLIVTPTTSAKASIKHSTFVRTANYFLLSGSALENQSTIKILSTFDLIIIPVEAQVYNKSFFQEIRSLNKDIIILPYIATVSWNDLYWNDPLHQKLYQQIKPQWWLTDANEKQISVWPGTRALNLNSGWNTFLPEFVKKEILSTGLWDGVFYDEVQDSISWVGATDVDKDKKNDSPSTADILWETRYEELFARTRSLVGSNMTLISNGSSNPDFVRYLNGRMFETFPSSDNSLTKWKVMTNEYLNLEQEISNPSVMLINVNTENTGVIDYQKIRFGLATTLLGNGYFTFDYGTENHAQLWTYDEYNAYLGTPKSSFQNLYNPQQTTINPGIWMREFEQGQVLVNATDQQQTIHLDGEFEKIHGTQDPNVNNGRIVSEVTLPSKDGLLLLRPIEEILDAPYLNGAFAKIYTPDGVTKRTGFFAYNNSQRGGNQIIQFDTDGDGKRETIVADHTYISIYKPDGSLHKKFAPYTTQYNRGITISAGDIENDGSVEIVTGTKNGGGPQVRVFNKDGVLINPGFFAYEEAFRGGVNVTIGDLNGDAIKEIICGAGVGGGPHVRVFRKDGTLINPGFFAYDASFRGGVNVSAGDVDGDGVDEIVTGPGMGGSPLARIFTRDGKRKSEFYLFDSTQRDGLEVVVSDVDTDGIAEIIGLTADVFTLSIF